MTEKSNVVKKKSFLSKLFEKVDNSLKVKSDASSCCCSGSCDTKPKSKKK